MDSNDNETLSKVEVLGDLEPVVDKLMEAHESKRVLWFPSELLAPPEGEDPERHRAALRERARGIHDSARVAVGLNLLTEEGLPHFHRLLAKYLDTDGFWSKWNYLWTAEEDRHGAVLHDYARDADLFDPLVIEQMQFAYIRNGFDPSWDSDPYRVFVYTTLQERATQVSHSNTGKLCGDLRAHDRDDSQERRRRRGAALHVLSDDFQGSARARSRTVRWSLRSR